MVADTARTRHSVLPAKDCCSYCEVVVTKISSLVFLHWLVGGDVVC